MADAQLLYWKQLILSEVMSALFRSFSSLLFSQQLESGGASNLVLERLYYADGRQNPDHPLHGSFKGLTYLDSP